MMVSLDDCFAVLSIKGKGLSAEAKYFLIRVLFIYGRTPVDATVLTLEETIGMTDAVLKKARDLLVEKKYLIRLPVDSKKSVKSPRGRPRERFSVADSLIVELSAVVRAQKIQKKKAFADMTHKQRLTQLLFWQPDTASGRDIFSIIEASKKVARPLRPATRILLAILYGDADTCGAVSGLSLATLKQRSSMAMDRLDSQLSKLTELGYISSRVSGLTGRSLFGRSAGAFFLNVLDDDLAGNEDSTVLILMKTKVIDEYNDSFWGRRIFLESQTGGNEGLLFDCKDVHNQLSASTDDLIKSLAIAKQSFLEQRVFPYIGVGKKDAANPADLCQQVISADNFDWSKNFYPFKLHELFNDMPRPMFARFLQSKINEFASILLSCHWNELKFDLKVIPERLIEKITKVVYPVNLRSEGDLMRSEVIAEALGLFLYRISFEVALLVKGIVITALEGQADNLSKLNKASYAILPVPYDELWANKTMVVVKVNDSEIEGRCMLIDVTKVNGTLELNVNKTRYANISYIGDETLKEFGFARSKLLSKA